MQLTYLLQNSLSGNSKTLVCGIACSTKASLTLVPTDGPESVASSSAFKRVVDFFALRYEGRKHFSLKYDFC